MIRILDPDHAADLVDAVGSCFQQMLCHVDAPPVQVLQGGDPVAFAKFPADPVFAHMERGLQPVERVAVGIMVLKQIMDLFYIRRNLAIILIFYKLHNKFRQQVVEKICGTET